MDKSLDLAAYLERISEQLEKVENRLASVAQSGLQGTKLLELPEISLRGVFRMYHENEQSLEIVVGHETLYYPLSYYDGAWLPMPNQQVVVSLTNASVPLRATNEKNDRGVKTSLPVGTAPVIYAYGKKGRAIPTAPRITLSVDEFHPQVGKLTGENTSGQKIKLDLPRDYSSLYDDDFVFGQPITFKIIRIPPQNVFVPLDSSEQERTESWEILQHIASL